MATLRMRPGSRSTTTEPERQREFAEPQIAIDRAAAIGVLRGVAIGDRVVGLLARHQLTDRVGSPARLYVAGVARVAGGRVDSVDAVTSRLQTARDLIQSVGSSDDG